MASPDYTPKATLESLPVSVKTPRATCRCRQSKLPTTGKKTLAGLDAGAMLGLGGAGSVLLNFLWSAGAVGIIVAGCIVVASMVLAYLARRKE